MTPMTHPMVSTSLNGRHSAHNGTSRDLYSLIFQFLIVSLILPTFDPIEQGLLLKMCRVVLALGLSGQHQL